MLFPISILLACILILVGIIPLWILGKPAGRLLRVGPDLFYLNFTVYLCPTLKCQIAWNG